MRKNLADAQRSSELKGKRSPARNTRNPEIITNVEILQVAKALVRVTNRCNASNAIIFCLVEDYSTILQTVFLIWFFFCRNFSPVYRTMKAWVHWIATQPRKLQWAYCFISNTCPDTSMTLYQKTLSGARCRRCTRGHQRSRTLYVC